MVGAHMQMRCVCEVLTGAAQTTMAVMDRPLERASPLAYEFGRSEESESPMTQTQRYDSQQKGIPKKISPRRRKPPERDARRSDLRPEDDQHPVDEALQGIVDYQHRRASRQV